MPYEIDFLRAGNSNGDAIVVKWSDAKDGLYYINVIDGGFTDTGDEIINHIETHHPGAINIANVILTHADNDHACGLVRLLECERFIFHNVWMNRPWDYVDEVLHNFHGRYTRDGLIKKMRDMHPYLVDLENIAQRRGIAIRAPLQGATIGAFIVLAPSRARYLELIPDLDKTPLSYAGGSASGLGDVLAGALRNMVERVMERLDYETLDNNPPATSASNETSVVQIGIFGDKRILLTGDVGPKGLTEAAVYADRIGLPMQPSIVQIPHHGSRRNVTPTVLNSWLGQYPSGRRGDAIASVGKDADIYPRKKVANAFTRRGYDVYATHTGWVNFYDGYDRRPNMGAASIIPFSPDVEDH